ncbi:MAG: zinc ribbon domain-containing protein [Anaerolineaceae bacterium]|nr:MAG: zinc ribbon domain-containing protein [Anaerolineaceae bacterium]
MTEIITNIGIVYAASSIIIIWIGMILWTLRDIKNRSRDRVTRIGGTLLVILLNAPGLILYLFLRPPETLSETYEKSLEEEALLQEIEEKISCPGCGQPTKENWQICPNCHTQLKRVCINCRRLIELNWNICPYCTTVQGTFNDDGGGTYTLKKRRTTEETRSAD